MNKYFRLLLTFTTFCFLGMLFALYKYYNLRIAFKNQGYTNIYKPTEVQPKTTQEIIDLTFMETETVQKIYQMFKDTVDLFEKLNIRYSVDGGSVIAIVRNKGLLPWDDDVDLVISQEDEPKLIYMIPMLKELGYEIIFDNSSYRIFDPNNPTIQGIKFTYPVIDISTVFFNQRNQKVEYSNFIMREAFPNNWYYKDKFFPLQKYKFGPLEVYGPNDPGWYIKHYYGSSALEQAVIYPRHFKPKHSNKITIPAESIFL